MTQPFVETKRVEGRRLGRRKPKNAPALEMGKYLLRGGEVPEHPEAADHFAKVTGWGLLGNDKYGDCGPVGAANTRLLVTTYLTPNGVLPSEADVFDLYRRSGNPNFDPTNDTDDNGVDLQTMCEALVSGGIGGVKALCFGRIDVKNLDQLRAAEAIFGSVLLGVNLETAQQTQTDEQPPVWNFQQSDEWGGHCVLSGKYASQPDDDASVISWATPIVLTEAFEQNQVEEAWAVMWPEHLGSKTFLQGVDVRVLAQDYQILTGQPFPGQYGDAPAGSEGALQRIKGFIDEISQDARDFVDQVAGYGPVERR